MASTSEIKDNLPRVKEMFEPVPRIMLGVEYLQPGAVYENNNTHRVVIDIDYQGSFMRMVSNGEMNQDEINLWMRVLSGAPGLIKDLLDLITELEQSAKCQDTK